MRKFNCWIVLGVVIVCLMLPGVAAASDYPSVCYLDSNADQGWWCNYLIEFYYYLFGDDGGLIQFGLEG